jgi:hypothetical protein
VAAFLPGDAITLVLETVPLYLLYEASILVASIVDRPRRGGSDEPPGGTGSNPPGGSDSAEPSVQQIIDHTDPDLSG